MADPVVPPDVLRALEGDSDAKHAFEKLPLSHKREYLNWVVEAKKTDTRTRRIAAMVKRLGTAST